MKTEWELIDSRELTQKTVLEGGEERERRYRECGSEDEEGFWNAC